MRTLLAVAVAFLAVSSSVAAEPRRTENVIVVMLDGIRWQDLFQGADEGLLSKERGGVSNVAETKKRFWRDSVADRRLALFPFLWGTVARDGQLFGSRLDGCPGQVTNKFNFSYPGYSEVLCGFADSKVDSNAKKPNRNATVLEYLNGKPELKGKVAAFASWDVFPFIINAERSGVPVNAGLVPLTGVPETPEVKLLNRLVSEIPLAGEDVRPDALTFHAAKQYLLAKKPRVLFLSFDETDTQAHAGRYDRVLASANRADGFVRELWETVQEMPEYKGKTTLIVTTDHGRGEAPVEWKSHGAKIAGAECWWAAAMGPDTESLGVRKNLDGGVTQTQIAATVAAALGYDYVADVPAAGQPLPGSIRK